MAFYYPDAPCTEYLLPFGGSNFYIVNVGKYFIHGTYGLEYSKVPNTTIMTNEVIQFVTQLDILLVGEFTFQKNHLIIPKKSTRTAKDVGMAFKPTNLSLRTQPIWNKYARQKGFIFRSFRDNEVNNIFETTTYINLGFATVLRMGGTKKFQKTCSSKRKFNGDLGF